MNRRRFLKIAAAATLLPNVVHAHNVWRGRAFGADISIDLQGNGLATKQALAAARDTVFRLEKMFSIYAPDSLLSKLNRHGSVKLTPELARLLSAVDDVHRNSNGLFDPTIQAAYANAMLEKRVKSFPYARVGWGKVSRTTGIVGFDVPNMAITLNGIAQGFATDRVTEVLLAHGFENAVVNNGEYRVGNKTTDLLIQDAAGISISPISLNNKAIATSSYNGHVMPDGTSHILSPFGPMESSQFNWDTVSVVAQSATLADGYSTH